MPKRRKVKVPDQREISRILWKASDDWHNTHGEREQGYIWALAQAIASRLALLSQEPSLPYDKLCKECIANGDIKSAKEMVDSIVAQKDSEIARLREGLQLALQELGRPTMSYAPHVELQELKITRKRVINIIEEALNRKEK